MTLTVIQARMGSTRLRGKVFADIGGRPVLEHVLSAAHAIDGHGDIVVATSYLQQDLPIWNWCCQHHVKVFRWHPTDVLERFHKLWRTVGGDPIIRITADCPLLDPELVPPLVALVERGLDYATVEGAPAGRICEVFSAEILAAAHRWAHTDEDREHVVPWMVRNGGCAVHRVEYADQRNVELNTAADLERIRAIAGERIAA